MTNRTWGWAGSGMVPCKRTKEHFSR